MFAGIHTRTIWSLIESLYSGEIMGMVKLNSCEKKREKYKTIQVYADAFCHELFGSEIWFLLLSLG